MGKKIISLLIIMALPLGFATAFSAQDTKVKKAEGTVEQVQVEKEEQCIVTKIEGAKVDLQNDRNEQFAMNIKDEKTLQELKVGDKVLVKNGKIKKEKEDK